MNLAPIALFVYNRPTHTRKTLEALAKSSLASESSLFIFADGAKKDASKEDLKKVNETRELIKSRKWCKETIINEIEFNAGLADSISAGVSKIVNEYGKIIVLEDDIIISKGFLKYMNSALDLYENNPNVFQVSGFMIPNTANLPNTFFYRAAGSWGWATWKRAWKYYNHNANELYDKIKQANTFHFDIDGSYPYFHHLELNRDKKLKTWAIRWYASIYLQNGLCLWPSRLLIRNIGHDGSGENCMVRQDYFLNQKVVKKIEVFKIEEKENEPAVELFKSFYSNRYLFISDHFLKYKIKWQMENMRLRVGNKVKSVFS